MDLKTTTLNLTNVETAIQKDDIFNLSTHENPLKSVGILLTVLNTILLPHILYVLTWNAIQTKKLHKTILNLFICYICFNVLVYLFLVQIPETVRFLFGPLPSGIDFIKKYVKP